MKTIPAAKKSSIYLGIIYGLVSIFLISYIPTLVPGRMVPGSASYIFGYDNRVGFALILLLTGIAVLIFWRSISPFSKVNDADGISPRVFWTCMAIALVAGLTMYLLTSRLGSYIESSYAINRIEMASHGLRPFRDFEFGYGACFVYVPLFFSRFFHISIPNSFYLFWTLNLVLGTWFLAELVRRLDYPGRHRTMIFVGLFLATLPSVLLVGLNYTAFRFALAPLLSIVTFNVILDGKLRSQIYGSLLVPFFTMVLLLVSPEIAVSYCFGMSAFMLISNFPFKRKSFFLPYLGMLLLIAIVLALANWMHLFDTLKTVANGGMNFPIIPSPSILFFLFAIFVCATLAVHALMEGTFRTNYICVLLVAFPMLSSCFSRCDPGHIFWNGLGIFPIFLLWASGDVRAWKYSSAAFSIVFVFLSSISGLLQVRGDMLRVYLTVSHANMENAIGRVLNRSIVRSLGSDVASAKLNKYKIISQIDASADPVVLPPQLHGIAEVPFGYGPSHNTAYLDYGFYDGIGFIAGPKAVSRKISELEEAPDRELLLTRGWDSFCLSDPNATKAFIRVLFIYPYNARAVHADTLYKPLCDYITSHYALAVPAQADTYDYEIWSPK